MAAQTCQNGSGTDGIDCSGGKNGGADAKSIGKAGNKGRGEGEQAEGANGGHGGKGAGEVVGGAFLDDGIGGSNAGGGANRKQNHGDGCENKMVCGGHAD